MVVISLSFKIVHFCNMSLTRAIAVSFKSFQAPRNRCYIRGRRPNVSIGSRCLEPVIELDESLKC